MKNGNRQLPGGRNLVTRDAPVSGSGVHGPSRKAARQRQRRKDRRALSRGEDGQL